MPQKNHNGSATEPDLEDLQSDPRQHTSNRNVRDATGTKPANTEAAERPLNKFSRTITQAKSQGGSQAMLYATGMTEGDMDKPQVRNGLNTIVRLYLLSLDAYNGSQSGDRFSSRRSAFLPFGGRATPATCICMTWQARSRKAATRLAWWACASTQSESVMQSLWALMACGKTKFVHSLSHCGYSCLILSQAYITQKCQHEIAQSLY